RVAAGTDAALLARKGNQQHEATMLTASSRETVGVDPTAGVGTELLFHVVGEPPTVETLRTLQKRRQVLLHQREQGCVLWMVLLVAVGGVAGQRMLRGKNVPMGGCGGAS